MYGADNHCDRRCLWSLVNCRRCYDIVLRVGTVLIIIAVLVVFGYDIVLCVGTVLIIIVVIAVFGVLLIAVTVLVCVIVFVVRRFCLFDNASS